MKSKVERAVLLVKSVHYGQVDKAGVDYYNHLEFVSGKAAFIMAGMTDDVSEWVDASIVGLLHDIVEDTFVDIHTVRDLFGDMIADAVDCITKRRGLTEKWEPRDVYIDRVMSNPIARIVKLADVIHNMDLSRLPEVSEEDIKRVEKYKKDIKILCPECP